MKRIIFTIAILIASGLGSLANEANQKLLALSERERHEALSSYVRQSGEQCDVVVRSMLRHGVAGEPAFWNVGCRNKKSYWVVFAPNSGDRALVLNCEESKGFGKMLADMARRAGQSPDPHSECWK